MQLRNIATKLLTKTAPISSRVEQSAQGAAALKYVQVPKTTASTGILITIKALSMCVLRTLTHEQAGLLELRDQRPERRFRRGHGHLER